MHFLEDWGKTQKPQSGQLMLWPIFEPGTDLPSTEYQPLDHDIVHYERHPGKVVSLSYKLMQTHCHMKCDGRCCSNPTQQFSHVWGTKKVTPRKLIPVTYLSSAGCLTSVGHSALGIRSVMHFSMLRLIMSD